MDKGARVGQINTQLWNWVVVKLVSPGPRATHLWWVCGVSSRSCMQSEWVPHVLWSGVGVISPAWRGQLSQDQQRAWSAQNDALISSQKVPRASTQTPVVNVPWRWRGPQQQLGPSISWLWVKGLVTCMRMIVTLNPKSLYVTFGGNLGPGIQHRPQPWWNHGPWHGPQQWLGLDVTTYPAEVWPWNTNMALHFCCLPGLRW